MRLDIIKTIFSRLNLFNQTSVQSGIATDTSRLYTLDDGSTVHLMATKDDNATETQVKLAEQSSITNLSSQGAAYFGNGTDQYLYIPDNANLRFGTGNFALIFKNLRLPDYTPSAAVTLARKANTTDYLGWIFTVETDGKPQIAFGNGANFTTLAYKSSVAIDATDATTIHLIAVVTRETASVAGSVNFYQFGYNTWKLLSSVAITAGTPQTVTETTPSSLVLFQNINGTTEYAFQSFGGFYPCNFAPTYAEVKEIVEKGVPYKYKGASQTELTANGDLTAWTGSLPDYYGTSANGTGGTWSNTKVDNGDATYSWMVTKTNSTGYVWIGKRSAVGEGEAAAACVVGKSYWLKLRYKCDSGGWQNSSLGLTAIIADGAEHTINEKFVNPSPYIPFIQLTTNTKYFQVYEWEINPVGCVAEYLPEGVGNYTWFDNSINAIHGTVNGATPVGLPPNDIQTAVKIGIANTATALSGIVPAGYYIKQIRAKGSTSLSGVKIGTSSGGEQVVASTSVETTPTLLTLASTANAAYSESAATTLYAQHGTAGATLDLYLVLERIK